MIVHVCAFECVGLCVLFKTGLSVCGWLSGGDILHHSDSQDTNAHRKRVSTEVES